MQIKQLALTKIKPYERNPRNATEAVTAVMKSIQETRRLNQSSTTAR